MWTPENPRPTEGKRQRLLKITGVPHVISEGYIPDEFIEDLEGLTIPVRESEPAHTSSVYVAVSPHDIAGAVLMRSGEDSIRQFWFWKGYAAAFKVSNDEFVHYEQRMYDSGESVGMIHISTNKGELIETITKRPDY